MKRYLLFFFHLLVGVFAIFALGQMLGMRAIFLRSRISGIPSGYVYEVNSLAWAFALSGLVFGYYCYSVFGGKSALWVWIFPVGVFLVRFFTFPAYSLFSSAWNDGINYFFGKAACSAPTVAALTRVAPQCVERMLFLGTSYSAIAYSAGALAKYLGLFDSDTAASNASASTGA